MHRHARRDLLRLAAALTGTGLAGMPAHAQDFPTRPVTLVVPYAAGGTADLIARSAAAYLPAELKQAVIVENRRGGAAMVAAQYVARANPDGYTLLFLGGSVLSGVFRRDTPFEDMNGFVPVAPLYQGPFVLAVRGSLPVQSLAEFIAYARANPGRLNHGSAAPTPMMAMEVLKVSAGFDSTNIPYGGAAPMTTALIAGQIDAAFDSITTFRPHLADGTLRVIAVGSAGRFAELPQVPTIAESGFPGFLTIYSGGVWAPRGTPPLVLARLGHALRMVASSSEFRTRVVQTGASAVAGQPEELTRMVRAEVAFWR